MFFLVYSKIKTDSGGDLPLGKMHNVMILVKSFFNKNQNLYDYNIFLEKCSYQLAKKQLQQNS